VNFSSRHYDFKRNRWVFEKATEEQIALFLERKVYWQTLATGGDVWIADETEAQYLDTTAHHLSELAAQLAKQGLWTMERAYATATEKLLSQRERFEADLKNALEELERKHAFERA
jgi:phosphoribosyl-dephospho-CoA transferase